MNVTIFQPAYPAQDSPEQAGACLGWMRTQLAQLQPGAQDLILLPEYASTPGLNDQATLRNFAESEGVAFLEEVAASARRLGCLLALAAPIRSASRWFNRTLVFDGKGELAFTYDKVHLTDAEKNDLGLTPGSMPSAFQCGEIRLGFATCFDLYFPEHFQSLAAQKVDLVLCPSYQRSETAERIRLVAQARALDSGAYLIRSSYAMEAPDLGGRSLIAAPDGRVLKDAGAEACVFSVELDPRQKFEKPASHGQPNVEHQSLLEAHRRPATYRRRAKKAQQISEASFPRLCAHRGNSLSCPENTLPAFASAMALGAHEIEFDVWASRDDVLVICHDASVDRTTDGTGNVFDLSWDEIGRLDAGGYLSANWRGVRVPRLEDILELTDGQIGLNIHIKSEGPGGATVRRVCDLVTEHALTDIAYLALETETALQCALEYAPEVPRGCLVRQSDPSLSIDVAQRYGCHRIQFGRNVKPEHIQRAHQVGLVCNLFYSDDPEEGLRYVGNGMDVILTNCVHTMIAGGFGALGKVPGEG